MGNRVTGAVATLICLAGVAFGAKADVPQADAIFARAKDVWRARSEAPFVSYSLRERYSWRGHTHDNWWQGAYRERDRNVALHRIVVAADEGQRLKGAPIQINWHIHNGVARADSLDTNPDADAFPILDPLIAPNASFGLVRREAKVELATVVAPAPTSTPTPAPASRPTEASALTLPAEKPLRELAHVEAIARDYSIAFAGNERVRGVDTYHLTLVPLRDPRIYRLRDLWIDATSFATVQIAVQGLFDGKPFDGARWIVDYVTFAGRVYVQQIHTDEMLRFGADRNVAGLQFDFVSYEFPASLPDMTFAHFAL
ncbi:MAG: hypothetical protein IAI50_20840 [Candidatus Eremiobacteraeota bacterium]|nr:hypothetical protein [Candidatus Eremiobacteraeota bacterium]